MRRTYLLLTLFLLAHCAMSQKYQNGGYVSLKDFRNNAPTYIEDFVVEERSTGNIKAWGGNDYKVKSEDKSTSKKTIKNEIWGIVKNDTLYINGVTIVGLIWYARVEIMGKYCFLRPSFPVVKQIQNDLGLNNPQYGYMFGAVGGAIQGAEMAVRRIPMIFNLETGDRMLLSEESISELLVDYPELGTQFESETDKKNEEILLDYLTQVNKLANNE